MVKIRVLGVHVQHLLALICIHIKETAFRMVTALIQAIPCEFLIASYAVKLDYTCEKFPEEVFPGDLLSPERQNKLV